MSLADSLSQYRASVSSALALIASAHVTSSTGVPLWIASDRQIISESAFLKFFIAWESFLEKSFRLFMMGYPSASGKTVTKYASPINDDHANRMLIGNMHYVDWSNPDSVRRLANLYFDNGEPYETVISAINAHFLDLKTIRNAAAHLSSTTSAQLDSLGTRMLQRPCASLPVYDLILAPDPSVTGGATILQVYVDRLDAAAFLIANA